MTPYWTDPWLTVYAKSLGLSLSQRPRAERRIRQLTGLKPKDLVGIPWRVAFALQADGWYLRSDIIWSKPNPMPESVTDRPTKSHEYLFLLAKSARYWYDADAVAEGVTPSTIERLSQPTLAEQHGSDRVPGKTNGPMKAVGKRRDVGGTDGFVDLGMRHGRAGDNLDGTRNLRSVWTVATQPYAGAHFATFPPRLIEPCIKAGSPESACSECGAPWVREMADRPYPKDLANAAKAHGGIGNNLGGQKHQDWLAANPRETTGWRPSCAHVDAPTVPGVVLDPFAGSGTTGMVAQSLARRAILIDLNADYLVQAMRRNAQTPLGLVEPVA